MKEADNKKEGKKGKRNYAYLKVGKRNYVYLQVFSILIYEYIVF